MKKTGKLALILILISSASAFGTICDSKNIESTSTLNKGRIKPLIVAASEFIKQLTGSKKIGELNALKSFCLISTGEVSSIEKEISIKIEHIESKKLAGLKESEYHLPISKAIEIKELVRSEIMSLKENNSYKKSLNKLWFKTDQYQKAINGEMWKVPTTVNNKLSWVSITKIEALSEAKLLELDSIFKANNENDIALEMIYSKSNIFVWSMLIALIGIFLTVMLKSARTGLVISWSLILVEAIGMAMRVMISGRAPITNMYETVLFSGFGALFIALIIYQFKKDKMFILGGLGYNILCLFMMKFADGMLSESISPLVPVLRDNFWLSTHVTTIILSYAALALSWMLANLTLFKSRFGTLSAKDLRYYEDLIYAAIKVGIVLLAAGIILGGVWADYSWGRFWGWDPKETWSLIVLLLYVAVLHGKSTSWINTKGFIIFSAAGFMSVMMAWFGVNYILATGLHSYGFSEGGAIFLGSFFITQVVLIIITGSSFIEKKNNA
jgi:cytochrome c-type biogenesis protein CcsB